MSATEVIIIVFLVLIICVCTGVVAWQCVGISEDGRQEAWWAHYADGTVIRINKPVDPDEFGFTGIKTKKEE